ncbi:SRPBCC family protein [Micromonospora sp. WMMD882]|uniref:SRPBCC family protein n=1 Tax=Micromonospora sp. WMMD882 TaxID=3015151 RepID=UPI00248B7BF7|nr:SRPBCC family protein [Micromonospora sp. WMMD882]WBB80926.1 SRPBCC family protein [Micromonospora sp. WMMD882]
MTVTRGPAATALATEITDILVAHCGLDPQAPARAPAATLAELGMDSLALLELQAVVADRYRARIPAETQELTIAAVAELVAGQRDGDAVGPVGRAGSAAGPADRHGHTENSIVVGAPLPLVWEVTNDVATWPDLFTEYRSVEILERYGHTVRFRLTMHPDPDGTVWSWVSERTVDPVAREVHAHRVETGPFEYMRIHWRYTPEPDGSTRMTWVQDFHLRPGAPLDDRGMEDRLNTNTPLQMAVIRDKVELLARRRGLEVDDDE